MIKRRLWTVVLVLLAATCISAAAGRWRPSGLLDPADPALIRWGGQPSSASGRKSCAEAYPVPAASKHWTECKLGQFSQCGGPDDCVCSDKEDRLTWHDCKEGSYAVCEDDHTCVDTCRY